MGSDTNTIEVAKKIICLLQDNEEREILKQRQHKYVKEHFTSEAMYNSYHSFYQQLLENIERIKHK